jgi:hypothetical protein
MTALDAPTAAAGAPPQRHLADPVFQAYVLLRAAFVVAPILFGLDKFAHVLVHWEIYLAPRLDDFLPGTAHQAMHVVGVVEVMPAGSRRSSSTCSSSRATTTSRSETSACSSPH